MKSHNYWGTLINENKVEESSEFTIFSSGGLLFFFFNWLIIYYHIILLMKNRYSGGYTPTHPTIEMFWDVVSEMTPAEQRDLLKFVTSCSRPPLLGFGYNLSSLFFFFLFFLSFLFLFIFILLLPAILCLLSLL